MSVAHEERTIAVTVPKDKSEVIARSFRLTSMCPRAVKRNGALRRYGG